MWIAALARSVPKIGPRRLRRIPAPIAARLILNARLSAMAKNFPASRRAPQQRDVEPAGVAGAGEEGGGEVKLRREPAGLPAVCPSCAH